jgi:protein ImuB
MSEPLPDASLYACLYQPPVPVGSDAGAIVHRMNADVRGVGSSDPTGRSSVHRIDADVRRVGSSDPTAIGPGVHRAEASGPTAPSHPTRGVDGPLIAIAAEFSPRYEQHRPDLVTIDLRGLSRLFGTPRTIGQELRREAASRGIRVHVAVAPTWTAALVLAVAHPGLTVVGRHDMADALARVPLSVLDQVHDANNPPSASGAGTMQARVRGEEAAAAMAAVKQWGLRTLGELASLPAADLAARLGRGGHKWQAIARGEDRRPLVPIEPEERFEATFALEWPIEGTEPLSFVLTRLLEPLSTRLERRDRGAAVLHVALGLVTREVHACRLELPTPLREVRALRTLALLDVEAHPPAAAIDRVTVTIEPTPGRILQHTLFTRPHPTPEQLSTLLARLGALMGQDRVGTPALVDSHRPGAFALTPFAIEPLPAPTDASVGVDPLVRADADRSEDAPAPISALRRYRQPVPARVVVDAAQRPLRLSTDRRGFAGGAVLACAGPWRSSGAWWEEETRQPSGTRDRGPWSRDEWEVAVADGAVYRIFRDRVADAWFIEGALD